MVCVFGTSLWPTPLAVASSGDLLYSTFMLQATYVIATTNRPNLLHACISRIQSSPIPDGWKMTVSVCGLPDDPGRAVAEELGCKYTCSSNNMAGTKMRLAAFAEASTNLYLITGDDDMQSPDRLAESIDHYEAGFLWSGGSSIVFHNVLQDKTTLWTGDPQKVGTLFSVRGEALRGCGGWPDVRSGVDKGLSTRLLKWATAHKHNKTQALHSKAVCENTLCLQHGTNIWKQRPFPDIGKRTVFGAFLLTGVPSVQDRVEACGVSCT